MAALLSVAQAAAELNLSPHTLNTWRSRGRKPDCIHPKLPFVKIGGKVGYRPEDVDALKIANLRRSTSDTREVA